MAEAPRLKIRRSFPRPTSAECAPFADAPTGPIADAQGRRGALPHWITPVSSKTRFFGAALTVRTRAADNLAPYVALKYAKPGDVLVVASGGAEDASLMGDILVGMAGNAGVKGVVTDGLVRDRAGIDATGVACFSRGLTPNSPQKDGPGEIGCAVAIGDVVIEPGDLIVGDEDGVVVVARNKIAEVAEALAAVREKEAQMEAIVAGGASAPAWIETVLSHDDVVFLD